MLLELIPTNQNNFPLGGLLIRGASATSWLNELQQVGVELEKLTIYPLPGNTANSTWGCFVQLDSEQLLHLSNLPRCQKVTDQFYLAEYATFHPQLSEEELNELFPTPHLFHPEIGLVELPEPLQWKKHVTLASDSFPSTMAPVPGVFIPKSISRFLLKQLPPEDLLQELEQQLFPNKKKTSDAPLTFWEKVKLNLLRPFFKGGNTAKSGSQPNEKDQQKPPGRIQQAFKKWWRQLTGKSAQQFLEKIQENYEDLEHRNNKQVDKLVDMFKKDLDEALLYAIPLDDSSAGRGSSSGQLDLVRSQWSLFNNSPSSGGSVSLGGDKYLQLREQYVQAAQKCLQEGAHEKAAFIYLKLLKDYNNAAMALIEGGKYNEAASIYLKNLQDKKKAAQCYEKGNLTEQAIQLYQELEDYEKAGDLYLHLNDKESADKQYDITANRYKNNHQYLKAALVYRNKMGTPERGQEILMQGWELNQDAYNCLNNYLENIDDKEMRVQALRSVFETDIPDSKLKDFMAVVQLEYKKDKDLQDSAREIAYQLVAENIARDESWASELQLFNRADKQLVKDTIRYKQFRRRRK